MPYCQVIEKSWGRVELLITRQQPLVFLHEFADLFKQRPLVLLQRNDVVRFFFDNLLGSLSNPVNSGGCDQYSHSHVLEIRQSERDALHVAQIIIQAFGYRIGYPSIGKCGN